MIGFFDKGSMIGFFYRPSGLCRGFRGLGFRALGF